MRKRLISMLLVLCMVFTMFPSAAFAEDAASAAIGTSGVTDSGTPAVCEHRHDDACGYVAAVDTIPGQAETPCDKACADTDGGAIDHEAGCAYVPATEETPAVAGAPCTHKCELYREPNEP